METSSNRTALGVTADIAQQIGSRLRRARESIGRSTSALSAKIKVREHYLVAIEDGQWNELPPGLNGRGLVRIYARELSVSVPELDQAANQSVMPAEQDAQAPYQLNQRKESPVDRELGRVRFVAEPVLTQPRPVDVAVKTNTIQNTSRAVRASEPIPVAPKLPQPSQVTHFSRKIESTPEEEPLDVVTPDVASILGINLESMEEPPKTQNVRNISSTSMRMAEPLVENLGPAEPMMLQVEMQISQNTELKNESQAMVFVEPMVEQPQMAETDKLEIVQETSQSLTESLDHTSATRIESSIGSKKNNKKRHSPQKHEQAREAISSSHFNQEEMPLDLPVSRQDSFTESKVAAAEEQVTADVVADSNLQARAHEAQSDSTGVAGPVEMQFVVAHSNDIPVPTSATTEPTSDSPESISSVGQSAAEEYLKSHQTTEETSASTDSVPVAASSAVRWAVALMAACVVALIAGKAIMRDSGASNDLAENSKAISAAATGSESTTAPAAQQPSASSVIGQTPDSAKAGSTAVSSVPVAGANAPMVANQQANKANAATAESEAGIAASLSAATVKTQEGNQKEAATAVAAPVKTETTASNSEQEEKEESAQTNQVPTTAGSAAAVLTLSEPIEIQINADGKKIYSGKHDAGKVDIKFNKRAEIFVQDGSKAKLKYAGWDHGALGQAGRKRRIVLNAETFALDRP